MPTLYLTVALIDRFLERKCVSRKKLKLVGVTAMLLASKVEEVHGALEILDLVYVTDRSYTDIEIIEFESTMINTLGFCIWMPTIWHFLVHFLNVAGLDSGKGYWMAHYYAERTLQTYAMLTFLPSMIAASAVYMARKAIGTSATWDDALVRATRYKEGTLKLCIRAMADLIHSTTNSSCHAVRDKYRRGKYMSVASIPLPTFH